MFKVRTISSFALIVSALILTSACRGNGSVTAEDLAYLCSQKQDSSLPYHGGKGTSDEPYLVCTAQQFYQIGLRPSDWGKHFIQGQNIDLAQYDGSTSLKTVQPIGFYSSAGGNSIAFTGSYNGSRFIIKNYTHPHTFPSSQAAGLFAYMDSPAQIKNVTVENVRVEAPHQEYVSVFSGVMKGGSIENCHITSGQIQAKSWTGGLVGHMRGGSISKSSSSLSVTASVYFAGGIAGYISSGSVSESYSNSTASALAYAASLVGYMSSGTTVSDSYATGDVTAGTNSGGLVGFSLGTIERSYSTGRVTASSGQDHAGLVGFALSGSIADSYSTSEVNGLSFAGGLVGLVGSPVITNSYFTDDDLGQGGTQVLDNAPAARIGARQSWDFDSVWHHGSGQMDSILKWQMDFYCDSKAKSRSPFAGGEGSKVSPYIICTAEQLHAAGSSDTYLNKHFKVFSDIDLSQFDGSSLDKTINLIGHYELSVGSSSPFTGSFNGQGFVISNFVRPSGNLSSPSGLFGYILGASLENIILNQVTVQASGQERVGGLVGYSRQSVIRGCSTNNGQIFNAEQFVGGLVGQMAQTKIYDSSSSLHFSGSQAGGLVGYMDNDSLIERSFATGSGSSGYNIGGLVGLMGSASGTNTNTIRNSYAQGDISGINNLGGLVGFFYGQIYNSYATGDVSGQDSVGGLTGWGISCTVSHTFTLGSVEGTTSMVGGSIGRFIACTSTNGHFIDDSDNGNGTQHLSASVEQDADDARSAATSSWDPLVWSGLGQSGFNPQLVWE